MLLVRHHELFVDAMKTAMLINFAMAVVVSPNVAMIKIVSQMNVVCVVLAERYVIQILLVRRAKSAKIASVKLVVAMISLVPPNRPASIRNAKIPVRRLDNVASALTA